MEMNLVNYLQEALIEIESLEDYHKAQAKSVRRHVTQNIKKYKYGLALDRYFKHLTDAEDIATVNEEDQRLVDEVLDSYDIVEKEGEKAVEYILKNNNLKEKYELDPNKALLRTIHLYRHRIFLNESVLIMLLVQYETFIAGLLHFLIENYPQAYLAEKSITYTELIKLNSDFNVIQDHLIDQEVSEYMWQPLSDWYKVLETKHKAKFSFDNGEFELFKEIYYRRNLIVHNQGIVNDIYLNSIKESSFKVGDYAIIDEKYIKDALDTTTKVLIGTVWGIRKAANSSNELAAYLFDYGYSCMIFERWDIAKYVYGILLQEKDQTEEERLLRQVNYWITVKNSEGFEKIVTDIKNLDVSTMRIDFVLAKYALLDDFEMVTHCLERALKEGFPVSAIREWPLFKQFRESEEYTRFVDAHKDAFAILGYEPEDNWLSEDYNSVETQSK